jgi:uncharacterized protein YaeQ
MALKSTIYKVSLQISDFDRNHYQTYLHNVALHPSETMERMLLRLLAFAIHADEDLKFTKGLSTDDEPDLWQKSLSDEIELWVDLGLPDLKRIRKAAGRTKKLVIVSYGGQKVAAWFEGLEKDLGKINNVSVLQADMKYIETLVPHVQRNMELTLMIQDGVIGVTLGESFVEVQFKQLYGSV